jgi:hypothetical protein
MDLRSELHETKLSRNSANQVSGEFEPSLWIRSLEIEILRAETRAQKAAPEARLPEIGAAETRFDLAKSRKDRPNYFSLDMASRDRTRWLRREDSNLRMLQSQLSPYYLK